MNKTQAPDLAANLVTRALNVSAHANTSALHVRFSGYDPRAAGGRQTLKLELRGELALAVQEVRFRFRSDLLAAPHSEYRVLRTPTGLWPPLVLSFSTKHKEHGQYPLEVQLHYRDAAGESHLWICTACILLPRANASLSEIHQVFLATQKNVRVVAEDGALAKLSGLQQAQDTLPTNMNIAIYAKDAAIAQLDMAGTQTYDSGKLNIGLSSLAWDEQLLEVAVPSFLSLTGQRLATALTPHKPKLDFSSVPVCSPSVVSKPNPSFIQNKAKAASLLAGLAHNLPPIRLFASEQWILGRRDRFKPSADVLLQHKNIALTRRISARHACVRRTNSGLVEIIDTSRYGVMVDGVILEKNRAAQLSAGMQIEFCASIKGIVQLRVAQIFPHALLLENIVDEQVVESIYLISLESRPDMRVRADPQSHIFFHHRGQFWHRDVSTQRDSLLDLDLDLSACDQRLQAYRYSHLLYEE